MEFDQRKNQRTVWVKQSWSAFFCLLTAFISGCATPQKVDYTAFRQSRPHSILILPPLNTSPDVSAGYSFLSQMTYPLAESGYYVFPVTVVGETFKQNGLSVPADIHAVPPAKFREIFGADSALYVTVTQYGSSYTVLDSRITVSADAKLVDLKTDTELWSGSASASDGSGSTSSGGLAGLLAQAIVKQVFNSLNDDASNKVAALTSQQLLSAGRSNGILYGPRSPHYGKEKD